MAAKKSVLFATASLGCGGVEKSLLAIMGFLPQDRFDVTLMLTEKIGALLQYVPNGIRVVETPFAPLDRRELEKGRLYSLVHSIILLHWIRALRMLAMRMRWRISGSRGSYDEIVLADMICRMDATKMPTEFDYAFAYGGGLNVSVVVRDFIKAPIKGIWCHSEKEVEFLKDIPWHTLLSAFTHRFATRQLRQMLNEDIAPRLPPFEEMPYYIDEHYVRERALNGTGFSDRFNGLRILTVGRLSEQKGIDNAIRIASLLKTDNLRFRWYVVGGGEEEATLRTLIAQCGAGDYFVLLGQNTNPYPFFKQCDIYAQPSRYEAYCITIAEARIFHKPIVCTNFVGAMEQLVDGETGTITPIGDIEAFYNALKALMTTPSLRERYTTALSATSADSTEAAKTAWRKLLAF